MKRFQREFDLFTGPPYLPDEFKDDFGDLIMKHFEPHLEGSLQVTVHSKHNDRHDPRKFNDWQLNQDISDLPFPNNGFDLMM